jgi:hypothetical protein
MRKRSGMAAGLAASVTLGLPATGAAQAGLGPAHADWTLWLPFAGALVVVFFAGAAGLLYLWRLQIRFLDACQAKQELALFAERPAGVPSGTVRSVLALFIVFVTIALFALSMLPEPVRVKFPDVLSGILGTVLGFYFGCRSAGASHAEEPSARPSAALRDHDHAAVRATVSDPATVEDRVRSGVAAARAVAKVLPADLGKKVRRAADGVDTGLGVADILRAGARMGGVLGQSGDPVATSGDGGPIRDALARAAWSFGRVLGGTVPPLAVATAVVGIGARLAGAAYERWVARVLHAPYSPELFSPGTIDANTGLSLLLRCPTFARVFATEFAAGDRAFARRLVERALSEEDAAELWREHAARFADREEFERGLDEFQRAAIEQEVLGAVPEDSADDAGGVKELLAAVDRLHGDEAARRDLDAIVLMANELKREGHSPEAAFHEARRQMEQAP